MTFQNWGVTTINAKLFKIHNNGSMKLN